MRAIFDFNKKFDREKEKKEKKTISTYWEEIWPLGLGHVYQSHCKSFRAHLGKWKREGITLLFFFTTMSAT